MSFRSHVNNPSMKTEPTLFMEAVSSKWVGPPVATLYLQYVCTYLYHTYTHFKTVGTYILEYNQNSGYLPLIQLQQWVHMTQI